MRQEPEDERREISYGSFLKGYLGLMVILLALGAAGEKFLGLDFYRTTFVMCGALFTLAGIGTPRRLYLIVRSTGWFSFIRDPVAMRLLLLVLGVGLLLLGFFARTDQLR